MRNFREFIIDPERLRSKRIYISLLTRLIILFTGQIFQLFLWDYPRRALLKVFHTYDSALWPYPEYNNQKCCSFEHPEYRPMNFSRYTFTEHVEAINKSKVVEVVRVIEADVRRILLLSPIRSQGK